MARFPLVCSIEGDYGCKLLMVDESNTFDEVAAIAADQLIGVFVPKPPPGTILRVRPQGGQAPFPGGQRIAESGILPMEPVEIVSERIPA